MNILDLREVEILGIEKKACEKGKIFKKVFKWKDEQYTGDLVYDPKHGDTLRNIRKNSKAKIWQY